MSLVEIAPSGVIGVGLGGVALALVVLALAVRAHAGTRRLARGLAAGGWSTSRPEAPGMGLVLGTALPPLLSLGGMVYAVQTSRAMILHSLAAADFGQKASFASTGLVRELGATFVGLLAFGVTLLLATAACMTGLDPGRMARLPDAKGMSDEIIMVRSQRNFYDHAVRTAGAQIVEVGLPDRYAGAGVRDAEACRASETERGSTGEPRCPHSRRM